MRDECFLYEKHPDQKHNAVMTLLPGSLVLFVMWLRGGDKEMEGDIGHLLQHKARVISWK